MSRDPLVDELPGAEPGEEPESGTRELRELARMESALVRADLEHPDTIAPDELQRLRYLLGFAALTRFEPGAAAAGGPTGRPEVILGDEVAPLRTRVLEELDEPLRRERDSQERLRGASAALAALAAPLAEARDRAIAGHAGDCSADDIDAEAGTKALVSVAGGGGGAGLVYIGAWEKLQHEGVVPNYVIGSSIGALLGLFRARARAGDWTSYVALAKTLDRRKLFAPVSVRRRYGLPGLLALDLGPSLERAFPTAPGERLRISDLEIPYAAVVAGVRSRSFERLPRRFRATLGASATEAPPERFSRGRLVRGVATRMWQVGMFFDPRVVKALVLGSDELTAGFDAIDAAGFSTAIPGVLHYDIRDEASLMPPLLDELFAREEVAALVDGGVASNVPAELAWRSVQAGRLGTRNAFVLAFDCFHPKWDPANLWLQPITQAVQLQMGRNALFADWIVRFEPTLSPANLVPEPERLDEAIGWGRASVEEALPFVRRMLEPVPWSSLAPR